MIVQFLVVGPNTVGIVSVIVLYQNMAETIVRLMDQLILRLKSVMRIHAPLMEDLAIGMSGLPVLRNAVEEIKPDRDDAITQLLSLEVWIALETSPNVNDVIWILVLQLAQLKITNRLVVS
jgi:hypothetical protein